MASKTMSWERHSGVCLHVCKAGSGRVSSRSCANHDWMLNQPPGQLFSARISFADEDVMAVVSVRLDLVRFSAAERDTMCKLVHQGLHGSAVVLCSAVVAHLVVEYVGYGTVFLAGGGSCMCGWCV